MSGIFNVLQSKEAIVMMKHLGYPVYLLTILGVAKILGVVAILQQKFRTFKEWAYAGFTIDLVGASASFYFTGDGLGMILAPMIFLAVMFTSYFLWKRVEHIKVESKKSRK